MLAALYATVLFFGFSWSRCFFTACPNVAQLAVYQPGGAPVLLDRNGEVFADLAPAEREIVPLRRCPRMVPQAFLAVEDQRFYEHGGVDWRRVGGARARQPAGRRVRPGVQHDHACSSPATSSRSASPARSRRRRRKLLEIRVAQEIERRYSKEEILELYLNHIYFGNRARGIEAAARQYFGRSAKRADARRRRRCSPALPKAPSHYDPRRASGGGAGRGATSCWR